MHMHYIPVTQLTIYSRVVVGILRPLGQILSAAYSYEQRCVVPCGDFHTVAELNSCETDHMAAKPKVFTICSIIEKVF